MFPTCRDIIQSNPMMVKVGVHEAIISRKELWDDSKATLKYFSTIIGSKSTKKISAEERHAGLAISAIDSVGETLHGASTNLLYKLAQIQLGIEGARICTRDGYIPARICTRYGYIPVTDLQRNHDEYVPITALRTVEASRNAYRRTIGLLLAYNRPAIGILSACYWPTIGLISAYDRPARCMTGFRVTMLIIVYSRLKLYNRN